MTALLGHLQKTLQNGQLNEATCSNSRLHNDVTTILHVITGGGGLHSSHVWSVVSTLRRSCLTTKEQVVYIYRGQDHRDAVLPQ